MRPSRHAIVLAALFSAILIHGCSEEPATGTTGGEEETSVRFTSPNDAAEVSASFEAIFEVTNGDGLTIHCSLDGTEVGTATDDSYTFEGVSEGPHTVSAELRDEEGVVLGSGDEISVTVLSGLSCSSVSDCNDDDDCTLDACDGGLCAYFDAAGCEENHGQPICKDNDDCDKFIEGQGACDFAQCDSELCVVGVHDDGYVCAEGGCGASSTCAAGDCVTQENTGCDDNDPCTDDSCDEETGACVNAPTDCDDGNPCTENACGAEGCTATPVEGDCDDSSPCTTEDVCLEGTCVGTAVVCTSDDPCVAATCDDVTGECVTSGASCDDDNSCTTDSCDEEGNCTYENLEGPCEDGDLCATDQDQCVEGICVGGDAKDCDDENPCSFDECDAATGECTYDFQDCNDEVECTTDFCDAATGICVNDAAEGCCATAADCGGDTCSPIECVGNACVAGEPTCGNGTLDGSCGETCDDGNTDDGDGCSSTCQVEGCNSDEECGSDACNAGVCNLDGTCSLEAQTGATCDDGQFCTENDACTASGACEGTALSCNDTILCTTDACDEANGTCSNTPNEALCGDSTDCQTWVCDASLGCQPNNIVGSCDDGDPCTLSDNCNAGLCIGQGQKPCVDGNPCTLDNQCVSGVGCDYTQIAENQACDDGDPCTEASTCQGNGSCGGGNIAESCADKPVCVFGGGSGEVTCTLDLAHANQSMLDSPLTWAGAAQFNLSFNPAELQFEGFFKNFNGFELPTSGSLESGHSLTTNPISNAEISQQGFVGVALVHTSLYPSPAITNAYQQGAGSIVGDSDFVIVKFTKTGNGTATLYMSDLFCSDGFGSNLPGTSTIEDEVIIVSP